MRHNLLSKVWTDKRPCSYCKYCKILEILHIVNSFVFWIVTPDKDRTISKRQTVFSSVGTSHDDYSRNGVTAHEHLVISTKTGSTPRLTD